MRLQERLRSVRRLRLRVQEEGDAARYASVRDLSLGASGADVGNLQRFLTSAGFHDMNGEPLVDDEGFGPRTSYALRAWQKSNTLKASGVFGAPDRTLAASQGWIPFLQARRCTILHPQRGRAVRLIVVHDMEYPETPQGAEWCADFFAAPSSPQASAHFAVDADSVVQMVREWDVAWHAPGANHDGIGIEHAGYAKQSREEWLDDYSTAELDRSAQLVARLCVRYAIDPVRLADDALRDVRNTGITGHADCTRVFSQGKGHWDPGDRFPWTEYLASVQAYMRLADKYP